MSLNLSFKYKLIWYLPDGSQMINSSIAFLFYIKWRGKKSHPNTSRTKLSASNISPSASLVNKGNALCFTKLQDALWIRPLACLLKDLYQAVCHISSVLCWLWILLISSNEANYIGKWDKVPINILIPKSKSRGHRHLGKKKKSLLRHIIMTMEFFEKVTVT